MSTQTILHAWTAEDLHDLCNLLEIHPLSKLQTMHNCFEQSKSSAYRHTLYLKKTVDGVNDLQLLTYKVWKTQGKPSSLVCSLYENVWRVAILQTHWYVYYWT